MPTLSSFQKNIQENKKELSQAEVSLGKIQNERKKLLRTIREQEIKSGQIIENSDPLQKKAADLQNELNRIKETQKNLASAGLDARGELFKVNPHQSLLENFTTAYPILLFPVRTQTRFITVKHVSAGLKAEDVLDLTETGTQERKPITQRLKQFHAVISNTDTTEKKLETDRAKTLLPPLPTGLAGNTARSGTLGSLPDKKPVGGFEKVEDKKELWLRIYPDDIFVHTHEEALAEDELNAARSFWEEIHNADTVHKTAGEERYKAKVAAWRSLVRGFGTSRASYIAKVTQPEKVKIEDGEPILNVPAVLQEVTIKDSSWTKAPCTYMLPDQFVVRLYSEGQSREVAGKPIPDLLILGLHPEEEDPDTFELENEERKIPDDIKWLTDFEEAEKKGMALRVPVSDAEFKNGFDKIIVLGVKLSQDELQGKETVERLFQNHQYALGGMSLLKQGTPTNNTSTVSTTNSGEEPASEDSFKSAFTPLYVPTEHHDERKDGQFLAEALGIDHQNIQHLPHADSADICEAIAMNKALYPATLGYALDQFYGNAIPGTSLKETRTFFQDYVLGRGLLPAIRVDKQPYGIIPTSSLAHWTYNDTSKDGYYLGLQKKVLTPFRNIWKSHFDELPYLTKEGATDKNIPSRFLEIMGLHASSVDFYQRFIAGPKALSNLPGQNTIAQLQLANKNKFSALFSLNAGWILDYGFLSDVKELYGPIIEGLSLSESNGLQKLKGTDKNYIDFLSESGIKAIREENFAEYSPESPIPPFSLLYLLLRHAMLREYLNVSSNILVEANLGSVLLKHDFELDQLAASNTLRPEHEAFLSKVLLVKNLPKIEKKSTEVLKNNISETAGLTERKRMAEEIVLQEIKSLENEITAEITKQKTTFSIEKNKFDLFDKKFSKLTGNLTVTAYIDKLIKEKNGMTTSLNNIQTGLTKIKDIPTARLERCFTEHLDCCNYRLDAWQLGLISQRLFTMRKANREGVYLGAFAILESLKPGLTPGIHIQSVKRSEPGSVPEIANMFNPVIDSSQFSSKAQLETFLKKSYVYLGTDDQEKISFNSNTSAFVATPVENRTTSDGFIHTPSTNHAIAAAILKSGFDAHGGQDDLSEALAVKLDSKRVRTALYILQGMRNGQEIAALLGYQFERGLHDNTTGNLDQFILDIRTAFPFNAGKINDPGSANIELAEAFNVVDGLSLLKAFQKQDTVPDAITGISGITQNQIASIKNELIKLDETLDAVNDLMVAESIFQMVVGSPDGSSAALKVLNESGELNQMPEIVNIPRKGHALTHKVGIQIPIDPEKAAWTASNGTTASKFSSSINNWLKKQLPEPGKIVVRVAVNDETTLKEVSMADIQIEPIDFVLALGSEVDNSQNGEIPIRAKLFLRSNDAPVSPSDTLTVLFNDTHFKDSTKICLFEIIPLVRSLYHILIASRHGMPEDLTEPSKSTDQEDKNGALNHASLMARLKAIVATTGNDSLGKVKSDLVSAISNLAPINSEEQPISDSDYVTYLQLVQKLLGASAYNLRAALPNSDLGFTFQTRDLLVQQANKALELLEAKQEEALTLLNATPSSDTNGGRDIFQKLKSVTEILFGRQYPVFPPFVISNKTEFDHAFNSDEILEGGDPYEVEDWLLGLSVVRPELKNYQTLVHLREVFDVADRNVMLKPVQLPYTPGGYNKWLGMSVAGKENIPLDPLSLVFEFPPGYSANKEQMALILDEWTEVIPSETVDSGIALHYNSPNSEASQNLLLAVPPVEKGNWQWEHLMDAISDTLEMAKMRAVEPKHLRQDSLLFRILPGIIAAVNAEGNTPSLDFGRNNVKPALKAFPPLLDINFSKAVRDE